MWDSLVPFSFQENDNEDAEESARSQRVSDYFKQTALLSIETWKLKRKKKTA